MTGPTKNARDISHAFNTLAATRVCGEIPVSVQDCSMPGSYGRLLDQS